MNAELIYTAVLFITHYFYTRIKTMQCHTLPYLHSCTAILKVCALDEVLLSTGEATRLLSGEDAVEEGRLPDRPTGDRSSELTKLGFYI